MKINKGDVFIYGVDQSVDDLELYSHLEIIDCEDCGYYFKQRIYFKKGTDTGITKGFLNALYENIKEGVWISATPLLLELL